VKKIFPIFVALALMAIVFPHIAMAQNPFETDLETGGGQIKGIVMKGAGIGLLITLGGAVLTTVLPLEFLKNWKAKFWGAFATILIIFFVMKMFPSIPKALDEIIACPTAVFGVKCD
jgi:uncharacterized BrkB/YihY/UPF0761 family membrane protein